MFLGKWGRPTTTTTTLFFLTCFFYNSSSRHLFLFYSDRIRRAVPFGAQLILSHSLRILYPITGEWLESYFLFLFGFLRAPINEKHLVPHALSDPISYAIPRLLREGAPLLSAGLYPCSRPPHGHAWQEKWRSGLCLSMRGARKWRKYKVGRITQFFGVAWGKGKNRFLPRLNYLMRPLLFYFIYFIFLALGNARRISRVFSGSADLFDTCRRRRVSRGESKGFWRNSTAITHLRCWASSSV